MKREIIYIAYGSNMNMEQMKRRCPNAKPIGKAILENYKLEFRGVANIIECPGEKVPIALWYITEECERALDRYEGYPSLYRKEYIPIMINGKEEIGMVYVMNRGLISPPNEYYLEVIKQGYKDFKIKTDKLKEAHKESYIKRGYNTGMYATN